MRMKEKKSLLKLYLSIVFQVIYFYKLNIGGRCEDNNNSDVLDCFIGHPTPDKRL